MADIEFNCPECGQVLEAPEEMAGEAIECPACEAGITIPMIEEDAEEDILVLPNLPNISIPSAAPAPDENACPECGTTLADGAVLCVACGYHLKLGKKISTEFD